MRYEIYIEKEKLSSDATEEMIDIIKHLEHLESFIAHTGHLSKILKKFVLYCSQIASIPNFKGLTNLKELQLRGKSFRVNANMLLEQAKCISSLKFCLIDYEKYQIHP